MTNRVTKKKDDTEKLVNCFDKFNGKNISEVRRKGLILSVIREINYNSLQ